MKLHKIIANIIKIYLHQLNLEVDNKHFFKKLSKLENWVKIMTFGEEQCCAQLIKKYFSQQSVVLLLLAYHKG